MRTLIIYILTLLTLGVHAQFQDTLSMFQYNILNYRNHFDSCNNSSNNVQAKEAHLRTILNYHRADLVSYNELKNDAKGADSIFQNVMLPVNSDYKMAPFSGSGFLANALFYNSQKLAHHSSDKIVKDEQGANLVRQIDVHCLYYNQQAALEAGDTTFLVVYQAHLKAGSDLDDLDERLAACKAIMNYHIDHHRDINYLLMGDLNLKSSTEEAYKELTENAQTSVRFNDPIASPGAWNSNSNFAEIHSQSTRSSETNSDCFSGGGLDDRFDFILCGTEMLNGSRSFSLLTSSYKSLGNDGQHFNKDILSPANNSVPPAVLTALYNCSDHLPIVADVVVNSAYSTLEELELRSPICRLDGRILRIENSNLKFDELLITNLMGNAVFFSDFRSHDNQFDLNFLASGVYVVRFYSKNAVESEPIILVE